MKNSRILNLTVTVAVAGAVFALGTGLRNGDQSTQTVANDGAQSVSTNPEGLLDGSPTEISAPEASEEQTLDALAQTQDPLASGVTTIPGGTPVDDKPATTTAPEDSAPVSEAPETTNEPGGEDRVYGADFPDQSPFAFTGWEEVYYMPENGVQAGLYGLEPAQVRSWVYTNRPGKDLAAEHQKIASTLTSAGGRINLDGLASLPADGTGTINGKWKGFTFVVVVTHWDAITFSLLDR